MRNTTLILFILIGVIGCKKDESRVIAKEGTKPVITVNETEITLLKDKQGDTCISFKWSASNFGFDGVPKYTLQIDKKGNGFANPSEKNGDAKGLSLKVGELNSLASIAGLDAGIAGEVEVRVKAEISPLFPAVYSDSVVLRLTTYLDLLTFNYMYVPGSHQGWNPAVAEPIADISGKQQFEGYVYFPDAVNNFKLTPVRNWDLSYGGTASDNAGTLSTSGGNLEAQGSGYYLLTVDMNAKTWKAEKTAWSIAGTATGGDDAGKDLAFDPVTKKWTITLMLAKGDFRFRANNSWNINFGDNKPGDPFLNSNGKKIPVTENGNYTITLDLGNPGNYMYSVEKK